MDEIVSAIEQIKKYYEEGQIIGYDVTGVDEMIGAAPEQRHLAFVLENSWDIQKRCLFEAPIFEADFRDFLESEVVGKDGYSTQDTFHYFPAIGTKTRYFCKNPNLTPWYCSKTNKLKNINDDNEN